jgi:MFS family permease
MPAAAALVPDLVGKNQIRHAMAIDRAVFHATRLAGPAVGGWLIAALGTASAFHANAASFFALLIALFTLPASSCKSRGSASKKNQGILEGIRHVRSDAPSAGMLLLLSQITLFISPYFMILMPLYSRHVLQIGPEQHGLLMGASGGGAFLGALHLLRIRPEKRLFYLCLAAAFTSLSMATLSQARSLSLAVPAIALMTLGNSTLFGLANTLVQERAPDPVRGRVSALAGLSFFGVLPFAGLAASTLADVIGLRTAMFSGACCFAVGSTLVLYRIGSKLHTTPFCNDSQPEVP